MNGGTLSLALVCILGVLLVAAALTDIRSRTIANGLTATIALLAPVYWYASGLAVWPDMAIQIGVAFGVLALFSIAFMLGQMGGGDVKLLAALALWLPILSLGRTIVVMALAGGALTLAMLAWHRFAKSRKPLEIPYGVAISFAGLWTLTQRYLHQFA